MVANVIPIVLLCFIGLAQEPAATFEVASIKPATPLGPMGRRADRKGGPETADPEMYSCLNCPISWVLAEAFDLQPFEFVGPDWLQDARFDFQAKVPRGATKAAFRAMLRNLLAERFKLAVHQEKRGMPVYEMTVAGKGPKFHESAPKDAVINDAKPGRPELDGEGFPVLTAGMTMAVVPGHARIRSDHQPMSWFV